MRIQSIVQNIRLKSFDANLRYLPIVEELKKSYQEGDVVLELGSGDHGLTPYFHIPVTGIDIPGAFSDQKSPLITAVEANGVNLPFDDNMFDHVLSVDMLEHVPPRDRQRCLEEMVRVSRRNVFIAVPTGEQSEQQDRFLDQIFTQYYGRRFHFLEEHVEHGLPRVSDLERSLRGMGKVSSVKTHKNFNLKLRKYLMMGGFSIFRTLRKMTYGASSLLTQVMYRKLSFGTCYRTIVIIEVDSQTCS